MNQERISTFSLSTILRLIVAFALMAAMTPFVPAGSQAFAEEPAYEETLELSEDELDASDPAIADDAVEESLDTELPEATETVSEEEDADGILAPEDEELETIDESTEASDQRENSFRYEDGVLISNSGDGGFQSRDMSLRAGADSYITFSQGPCSGSDAGKGIDVSRWQGNIDWGKVNFSGVDFAILKCASGISFDEQFANNVRGCRNAGVRFGVYYYTYATSPSQGTKDAERVVSQLRAQGITPANLSYPIYYDLEDKVLLENMSTSQLADLTYNFVVGMRNAGYTKVGVYANMDWWVNKLTASYFKSADLYRWVAQYNSVGLGYNYSNHPFGNFRARGDIWQFSSSGRVNGISGNVDLNYTYLNRISGVDGAMFRLYNPNSGEHFYTASAYEGNHLVDVGWNYEGVAWIAPAKSNTPVYRMYNPNAGDHHYTTSSYERDSLVSVGWNYEGIGWYSDDAKKTTLYRLYNPNARAGAHHYTTSAAERDMLVGVGWNAEGIGWYGC